MTASPRRLGLVHTSATLVSAFEQLCRERLPGVAVFNIVDDSLIKDVIAQVAKEKGLKRGMTVSRAGVKPCVAASYHKSRAWA